MFSRFGSRPRVTSSVATSGRAFVTVVIAVATAMPVSAQTTTNKLRSGQQFTDQQAQIPQSRPATDSATKPAAAKPASQKPASVRQPVPVAHAQPAQHTARSASLVRRAAHGELVDQTPPSRIATSDVVSVGHTCGCDQCAAAHHAGQIGYGEVGCGIEPLMPFEPNCGLEPDCGGYGCDVGVCNDCVGIHLPILRIDWRPFEFFAGVNSFTGPANHASDANARRGGSGSFGFYEGFNAGRSLNRLFGLDLSSQFGMRATQSSFSGAEFTDDSRSQVFVTGGLFRRVDFGLQYGLVVDYLYDDWWYRNNLTQLRGEISWNDNCGREFGYQFTAGSDSSTSKTTLIDANNIVANGTASFAPTNQHRLFLRGNTAGGASYMAFAGGTDRGDGLLGGILTSNFRNRFAVQGGVTYLIPSESNRAGGYENESWNLSMGVVLHPGGKIKSGRYCRPMFDVADNGSFLVDRKK